MTENELQRVARREIAGLVLCAFTGWAIAQHSDAPTELSADTTPGQPTDPNALGGAAPEPEAPALPADQFHLSFTPLVWAPSFSGTTGVLGLEFDVDESFLDIIDASDSVFGLMGAIDIEYKRLVFQLNGVYSVATFSGQRDATLSGPGGGGLAVAAEGNIDVDVTWLEAFGGYRFIEKPLGRDTGSPTRLALDGFVGGRVTLMELEAEVEVDATLTLADGSVLEAGRQTTLNQDEGWLEPFVGARMAIDLNEHWMVTLRGDVGGFGVDDSDFAWSAAGVLAYWWRVDDWTINLFGGYRALGQDFHRDGFTWDMIAHGPVLGAQFTLTF